MFILLVLGCAKATPAATPATLEPGQTAPSLKVDVPPSAARLRGLLMARHPEDLPGKAVMDQHGAPEALHWLAGNDELLLVRARALNALADYPDDPSQKLCQEVFGSDAHAKLRAAAITCLGGSDLTADAGLRDRLLTALRDTDPRVGLAAAHVLVGLAAARPGLVEALKDAAVVGPVRDEVAAILGG